MCVCWDWVQTSPYDRWRLSSRRCVWFCSIVVGVKSTAASLRPLSLWVSKQAGETRPGQNKHTRRGDTPQQAARRRPAPSIWTRSDPVWRSSEEVFITPAVHTTILSHSFIFTKTELRPDFFYALNYLVSCRNVVGKHNKQPLNNMCVVFQLLNTIILKLHDRCILSCDMTAKIQNHMYMYTNLTFINLE